MDTTEWLPFHFSLSSIGEVNGNPHQSSCLENPRDGGAWWVSAYGVAQSRTWLKRLSSSSSGMCLADTPFQQKCGIHQKHWEIFLCFQHQKHWEICFPSEILGNISLLPTCLSASLTTTSMREKSSTKESYFCIWSSSILQ